MGPDDGQPHFQLHGHTWKVSWWQIYLVAQNNHNIVLVTNGIYFHNSGDSSGTQPWLALLQRLVPPNQSDALLINQRIRINNVYNYCAIVGKRKGLASPSRPLRQHLPLPRHHNWLNHKHPRRLNLQLSGLIN